MGLRGPKPEMINEDAMLSCSQDSDYWCGILATEGCIGFGAGRSVPLIRYGAVDIEHVYKFRDFLGSKRNVQLVDRMTGLGQCKYGLFAVANLAIGDFLIKNGITPKKSFTLRVSDRLAKSPDQWRGAIDGDGSVCFNQDRKGSRCVTLAGCSLQYIEQFAQFCFDIGLDPCISLRRPVLGQVNGYSVSFAGDQCIELVTLLYGNKRVSLDRKQAKANQIMALSPSGHLRHATHGPRRVRYGAGLVQKDFEVIGRTAVPICVQ